MARAATSRLKVNAPLGSPPTLEWRAVGELMIDPTYQRTVDTGPSQTLIRRIAMFWDWMRRAGIKARARLKAAAGDFFR